MNGVIIIHKNDFKSLQNVCEDRFNGTYKVKKEHEFSYIIEIDFGDIQDVFSLGRILEQESLIQ